MNAVVLAILVMVGLSLSRVSVVFALIIAAIFGGLYGGLSVQETMDAFNKGLGNGANIALSYAVLGAFAVALSRSGLAESLANKAISRLNKTTKGTDANRRKWIYFSLLGVLMLAAVSSQNIIPVHIAFIPILVPPLLGIMNQMQMDRRVAACVITFGLVATYMLLPIGFGSIFLYDILLNNLNTAGAKVGLHIQREMVPLAMAIPFSGMVVGLLIAVFFSYRKKREYQTIQHNKNADNLKLSLKPWQIVVLVSALLLTVFIQLKFNSMVLGGLLGFAILSMSGVFEWREQDSVFVEGMRMMALVGFIMISAAGFASVMQSTGQITTLVESSAAMIGDNKGLAALIMLLVGLFITLGIGSSFSTIPIITSLYVPLAVGFGFSPMATVALVGTAAALGDAGSPASDSTIGPTAGLNVDGQHDHIWDSVVPTFIHYNIPLVIFGWIAAMIL